MAFYETKILKATKENIELCSDLIKQGEVIGIPTETVYGLAGNALNPLSIKKIFSAKGRPQNNPLIVHICNMNMLSQLVLNIPKLAYTLAEKFWPGPLTMIFQKKSIIPFETSGGLDTVGIRMPSHKIALQLIETSGLPLAAPSANTSGFPSPTMAKHVYDDLNNKIPAIIDGGSCDVGVESTVISFEDEGVRILRPGLISKEDLSKYCNVFVDKGVIEKINNDEIVRSPGMKYKHYSPNTDIAIVEGTIEDYLEYIKKVYTEGTWCVVFNDDKDKISYPTLCYGNTSEENAHELFDVLRKLDSLDAKKAYFRCPNKNGTGLAVYNRLLRSAGFEVIKL